MGRTLCKIALRAFQELSRLGKSCVGASTIEQAIFVALIIGASLAVVEGLGVVSRSSFLTVVQGLDDGASSNAGRNANVVASEPVAEREASLRQDDPVFSARFVLLLVACPFGAICWYFLYRDSRKKQRTPVDQAPPPAAPQFAVQDAVFEKRQDLLRAFSGDVGVLFTSRMRIRQVMTRNVLRVLPSTSIDEVRRIMKEKKIRHLLVCDARERLVGVISDRDIHRTNVQKASEVMSSDPVSVEPNSLVNPAVTLLLQKRFSSLPVVENGRVVGVVTTTDLLMALQCTLHALQRAAAEAVAHLPPDVVPGFMLATLDLLEEAPAS
jgi:CBS domain-containing protein